MEFTPFKLEQYFAEYEFSVPHLLSCSDCEPLSLKELMTGNEELNLWKDLKLGYTHSLGHPDLRKEISRLYENIDPQQVLVVVPEEGIFISMNTLLNPGDHVITSFPGYQSLYEIAQGMGCSIDRWEPDTQLNFNIQDLFDKIQSNTRLIVINFPHNPTGAQLGKDDYLELLKICRNKGIYLFSDEMYRFLEHDPNARLPSASDLYENAISLFGMSKTYALPGLRIGWLTSQNKDLLKKFQLFKDYTTICNSAPSEILAIIALQKKEMIVERNLKIINQNLQILKIFFNNYPKIFRWLPPKGGSITFPEFLPEQSVDSFCKGLAEHYGVMLLPSTVFDYEKQAVRFGFGRKDFNIGLSRLEAYLNA